MRGVLKGLQEHGKTVLIVGTKIQSRELVRTFAERTGSPYVNTKWVPGLLTNFSTLKRRITNFNRLEEDLGTHNLDNLTKKERAQKMKDLEKLRKSYEGVKDMRRIPDAVLVIDGHYEALALREAKTLGVTSIALLGSTGDIDAVDYFIPCNVNAPQSLAYVLGALEDVTRHTGRPEAKKNPSNQTKKIGERRPGSGRSDLKKKRDNTQNPSNESAPEAVEAPSEEAAAE